LSRAIFLAAGVGAAVALYFTLSLSVLPQAYREAAVTQKPEPVVTGVSLSSTQVALGKTFTISVTGTNSGDDADMQIVSVGFPNLTSSNNVVILRHDFRQYPFTVNPGLPVGTGYEGTNEVAAQYPSIEAYSRPWERGSSYSIDLRVEPQNAGLFVVYVKSVALPHSWDGAHYPRQGVVDYQREYVESYSLQVTKS
jgi:hypothetical protein